MSQSGKSRANQNREIRQKELREYLSARGKLDYILDNIEKLEDLSQEIDAVAIQRIKAATDTRVKLLDKYMPSLQAIAVQGEIETKQRVVSSDAPTESEWESRYGDSLATTSGTTKSIN